jgi:vacuolar-type H+-ATPase subunit H
MTKKNKDNPTKEALAEIKRTEKKSHRIIKNAREKKAYSIIQKAHRDAESIKEKTLSKSRKKAQSVKSEIIEKASEEAVKIQQETKKEIFSLNKAAKNIMTEAAAKTNKKILDIIEKESW